MSDELDKLATALKNVKPENEARQRGMTAAMAAFDAEFARNSAADAVANTNAEKNAAEKNRDDIQGLTAVPRPTGQTTRQTMSLKTGYGRVQTLWRNTVTTLSKIFNFSPKTVMMGSSCMAALLAALVILPANTIQDVPPEVNPAPITVDVQEEDKPASDVKGSEAVDSSVTEPSIPVIDPRSEIKRPDSEASASDAAATPPPVASPSFEAELESVNSKMQMDNESIASAQSPVAPPPVIERQQSKTESANGISSVRQLLDNVRRDSSLAAVENRDREAKFKARRNESSSLLSAESMQPKRRDELSAVLPKPAFEQSYQPPTSNDEFETYESNPVTSVAQTPVSTFSIDVDTASYSFMRASLNRGQLPPAGAIRLEEMINYFPYDYEAPKSASEPFKANVTVTPTPWNADTKLMHVGIKGYVPPAAERPRSNIVLLIDTSGSMRQANKLPLLISSFKLLLSTLDEDDTVSIVTYAGSAGTVLEPTKASDKHKINAALQNLRAGGSTAGAAGLELAYMKAQESFDNEGVNRVILATDGDFNVGFSSHEEMKTFITKKRETGIFLSVLGFGAGNYNDQLMQALAQNGNGVAAYIDTLSEANKVLANEAGSALFTIAKDVKIQVEFNPDTISEYRLIGYETRALKREDFNNDKVDAGEIGAGHTVTAIYEITPVNSPAQVFDKLRYVADELKLKTRGSDELAFVKIRHKLPSADKSTLQTFPVGPRQERSLERASDDMRFAAAVAAVGQKLRGDTQLADYSYSDAIKLASGAKGADENGYRAEFVQLIRLAESLQD